MVSVAEVKKWALAFPETDEHPHFERNAFRVRKKIFATLSAKEMIVSLKLTLKDQSVFCSFDPTVMYPVPGGWGKMGFTYVNLKKVRKSMFRDALRVAWCTTAPSKLSASWSADNSPCN